MSEPKIDLATMTNEWLIENNDFFIKVLHEKVMEGINQERSSCTQLDEDSKIGWINMIELCAWVVGVIFFGLEIWINPEDDDDGTDIIHYYVKTRHFGFNNELSWVNIGLSPNDHFGQDHRMLKLARQKRKEIIEKYQLRQRLESWTNDSYYEHYEIETMDDAKFMSMYFAEMDRVMNYLIEQLVRRSFLQQTSIFENNKHVNVVINPKTNINYN